MKINKILTISALATLTLAGCDDMFEPNIENNRDFGQMINEPVNFYGLLMNAYSRFNDGGTFYSNRIHEDLATSDFYSNDPSSSWLLMGRGTWRAKSNPVDKWGEVRQAIQYINLFLKNMDQVTWSKNEETNEEFKKRLTGEAYALRGIHNYFFLRAHAGYVDGESAMMGIPILTEPEDVNSDFNIPRATFKESLDQIMTDLNEALKYLPDEYKGEDLVNGQSKNGLINGTIVKAVRSQVALMAASPLFASESGISWKQAADYAAEVLKGHTVVPDGNTWYCHTDEINALSAGALPPEVIWRGDRSGTDDTGFESDCFPPTLDGKGRINPTQNLVDAFPMSNGYPIDKQGSGYSASNPYANRDPRLDLYIIHDGSRFKDTDINTCYNSETNDGLNKETELSTTTGYYLKKFMNEEVSLKSGAVNGRRHYKARIRYTEIFLNYAEAQNEAEGPQAAGSLGMSPYDIVKAIRKRGGITNDLYLESIKSNKDEMRKLIHNERRIELMGENFRFWDLRRWQEPISEAVKGIRIEATGSSRKYEELKIDDLRFGDYMYFGPIPETEVLKWSNLKQNKGWE